LDYCKKRNKIWSWTDPLMKIAQGTARGIAYLHSARYYNDVTRIMKDCILHRDIKPGNILLSETFCAKLSDFGHSKALEDYKMSAVGTPLFMSPEVIRGDRYGTAADVYSFAMTLWALNLDSDVNAFNSLCNDYKKKTGYEPQNSRQLMQLVGCGQLRPTFNTFCVKELAVLIQDCWSQEEHKRPNFKEVSRRLEGDVYEKVLAYEVKRGENRRKQEEYEQRQEAEKASVRKIEQEGIERPVIDLPDDVSDCSVVTGTN